MVNNTMLSKSGFELIKDSDAKGKKDYWEFELAASANSVEEGESVTLRVDTLKTGLGTGNVLYKWSKLYEWKPPTSLRQFGTARTIRDLPLVTTTYVADVLPPKPAGSKSILPDPLAGMVTLKKTITVVPKEVEPPAEEVEEWAFHIEASNDSVFSGEPVALTIITDRVGSGTIKNIRWFANGSSLGGGIETVVAPFSTTIYRAIVYIENLPVGVALGPYGMDKTITIKEKPEDPEEPIPPEETPKEWVFAVSATAEEVIVGESTTLTLRVVERGSGDISRCVWSPSNETASSIVVAPETTTKFSATVYVGSIGKEGFNLGPYVVEKTISVLPKPAPQPPVGKIAWVNYDFEMVLPFTEGEILKGNFLGDQNYLRLDGFYNYYNSAYEAFLRNPGFGNFRSETETQEDIETFIPHIYLISDVAKNVGAAQGTANVNADTFSGLQTAVDVAKDAEQPSRALENEEQRNARLVTLNGQISKEAVQNSTMAPESESSVQNVGGTSGGNKLSNLEKLNSLDYFASLNSPLSSDAFEAFKELSDKQKNIVVSGQYKEGYYRYAPMFNVLEFTTDKNRVFAHLLAESNYLRKFVVDAVDAFNLDDVSKSSGLLFEREFKELRQWMSQDYEGAEVEYDTNVNTMRRRCFDIREWFQKLWNNVEIPKTDTIENHALFFGNYLGRSLSWSNGASERKLFYEAIAKMIFVYKLNSFRSTKMRTYEDILRRKPAYAETVYYKVSKYKGDGVKGQPIQTIYFVNDGKAEDTIEKYVDNQVRYGQHYTYDIKAYVLVVGTEYTYEDYTPIKQSDSSDSKFTKNGSSEGNEAAKTTKGAVATKVEFTPRMVLVEEEYERVSGVIYDRPPVFPDIEIVPFRRINNEVKLILSPGVGSYYDRPVAIQVEDIPVIRDMLKHQKVQLDDRYLGRELVLNFVSDDPVAEYEIYRVEKEPRQYSDFRGALVTTLKRNLKRRQVNTSFNDSIRPNMKYWYMARSVDIHGHTSNPSIMYELEMIDTDGVVYAIIKPFYFQKSKLDSTFLTFKGKVRIKPTLAQGMINEKKTSDFYANKDRQPSKSSFNSVKGSQFQSAKIAYKNMTAGMPGVSVENTRRTPGNSSFDRLANSKEEDAAVTSANVFSKVFLSIENQTVWGKRFKVRLTSRSTGRKIDINFTCSNVLTKEEAE